MAVHHHHEWWDGTGYPDGLAGAAIPIAARIISIADAFDTMNSDLPYRDGLNHAAIEAEFRLFAGIQFDPDLVKEFLAILETGVCDIDHSLIAEAISETASVTPPEPVAG